MHPRIFWSSGGSCGFFNNYSDSYVNQAPWEFTQNDLPEQFQEYFEEISENLMKTYHSAAVAVAFKKRMQSAFFKYFHKIELIYHTKYIKRKKGEQDYEI